MNWTIVGDAIDSEGLEHSTLVGLLHQAGADEVTADPEGADAVLVVIRTRDAFVHALEQIGKRALVLIDASDGPGVALTCAHRWPSSVVCLNTATAVAHLTTHGSKVVALSTSERPVVEQDAILLVGGDSSDLLELVPECWERLRGCTITVASDDVVAHLNGRFGTVILLPASTLLPDVVLAHGHPVVSDRAPLLVDWTLVPTLQPRSFRGRHSVGLVDVLGDSTLRSWLAVVGGGVARASVRIAVLDDAIADAVSHVVLQTRLTAMGFAVASRYLADRRMRDIGAELDAAIGDVEGAPR